MGREAHILRLVYGRAYDHPPDWSDQLNASRFTGLEDGNYLAIDPSLTAVEGQLFDRKGRPTCPTKAPANEALRSAQDAVTRLSITADDSNTDGQAEGVVVNEPLNSNQRLNCQGETRRRGFLYLQRALRLYLWARLFPLAVVLKLRTGNGLGTTVCDGLRTGHVPLGFLLTLPVMQLNKLLNPQHGKKTSKLVLKYALLCTVLSPLNLALWMHNLTGLAPSDLARLLSDFDAPWTISVDCIVLERLLGALTCASTYAMISIIAGPCTSKALKRTLHLIGNKLQTSRILTLISDAQADRQKLHFRQGRIATSKTNQQSLTISQGEFAELRSMQTRDTWLTHVKAHSHALRSAAGILARFGICSILLPLQMAAVGLGLSGCMMLFRGGRHAALPQYALHNISPILRPVFSGRGVLNVLSSSCSVLALSTAVELLFSRINRALFN